MFVNYNYLIIGAGIVGLAAAYKLLEKKPGVKICILEKESAEAMHQTGNNSGVIHSGVYYKPGSLKASNCRSGYELLLTFCRENDIKHEICGKVIVAVSKNELPALNLIFERGNLNGLNGIKKLSKEELLEKEPYVNGIEGIFVPQTGIVDFKDVSKKLLEIILRKGADVFFNNKVIEIRKENRIVVITGQRVFETDKLISCAGLFSDRIAELTEGIIDARIIPFRGEYYKLKEEKRHLVKSLIYPVPDPAFPFLGVHFTRMINGEVEAGPNAVFAFKREGYRKTDFNFSDTFSSLAWKGFRKVILQYWKTGLGEYYRSFSKNAFVSALQKLIPEICKEDLIPGGSGVRAQACDRTGGLIDDFLIFERNNLMHVINAPSPAATSSLSIGGYIAEKIL